MIKNIGRGITVLVASISMFVVEGSAQASGWTNPFPSGAPQVAFTAVSPALSYNIVTLAPYYSGSTLVELSVLTNRMATGGYHLEQYSNGSWSAGTSQYYRGIVAVGSGPVAGALVGWNSSDDLYLNGEKVAVNLTSFAVNGNLGYGVDFGWITSLQPGGTEVFYTTNDTLKSGWTNIGLNGAFQLTADPITNELWHLDSRGIPWDDLYGTGDATVCGSGEPISRLRTLGRWESGLRASRGIRNVLDVLGQRGHAEHRDGQQPKRRSFGLGERCERCHMGVQLSRGD
jgi:hypothetical protein